MIATVAEIKSLLQLSDSTYDTYISAIMPSIEGKIFSYTNNHFCNEHFTHFVSSAFVFSSTDNSISLTGIDTDFDLAVGDTIRVYKSLRNNKVFTISSMSTDKIVLNSIAPIKDEVCSTTGVSAYITTLEFPEELKMTVASMVQYKISNFDKIGMASEKIDDYQVQFSSSKEYPMSILAGLNDYRYSYLYDLFSVISCQEYDDSWNDFYTNTRA